MPGGSAGVAMERASTTASRSEQPCPPCTTLQRLAPAGSTPARPPNQEPAGELESVSYETGFGRLERVLS
jgi:hypothetical protein